MNKSITIFLLFILTVTLKAQDPQYAQYHYVPMTVSPAFTGVMKQKIRITANARRQWNAVPNTKPWEQSYFSVDSRKCFGEDFFAYGLELQADRVGPSGLSNMKAAATFAYHHKLQSDVYLSLGASAGLLHYRLGNDMMTFDSQFGADGYDPNLSSLEDFETTNRSVFDSSVGLLLFNADRGWTGGFAFLHVNQPNYSFQGKEENRLGYGLSVHASKTINLLKHNKRNKLIVRGLYRRQSLVKNGQQWYSIAGATWKYYFRKNAQAASIGLGLSGRISGYDGERDMLFDAILPTVYLDYEGWSLGLSYDVNVSPAVKETHARGAFEVSLIFELGGVNEDCVVCPGN